MKKHLTDPTPILIFSAVCCLLSAVLLAFSSLRLLAAGLILFLLCGATILLLQTSLRRRIRRTLTNHLLKDNTAASLENFSLPVAILNNDTLLWYNSRFLKTVLQQQDAVGAAVRHLLPPLNKAQYLSESGQDITVNGQAYTVYGTQTDKSSSAAILYWVENTQLKWMAAEYRNTRPAVLHIVLDTYDELRRDLRTSELGRMTGAILDAVNEYIARDNHGFVVRLSSARYLAVVDERDLVNMIEGRFSLLDTVRALGGDSYATTLSIGVSRGADNFMQGEENALAALDMALGRGGDQAAVKEKEGYSFYGGLSRSVEKRSKVKARIIAGSLTELIGNSDNVIIMGHRMSDMDCVGAAVGVLRICKILNKPACIAVRRDRTLAGSILRRLDEEGLGRDLVEPSAALNDAGPNSLLVIVDAHVPEMLESKELFDAVSRRVVIDHHRKMVGFIEDALVFYHESYASSACELVAELLPYVVERADHMLPIEAEAMLAGIMLDTRDFTIHTGVRTFEAAGYLRRMGAQTASVKLLFSGTLDAYAEKSRLVTAARIYRDCAIAFSASLPESMRVVIPQAANDLLGIEGVRASFVGVLLGDAVNISARSMGDVNVQIIMEKIQGGGHLMMAGTQLKGVTLAEAEAMLCRAIDEYWSEQQA